MRRQFVAMAFEVAPHNVQPFFVALQLIAVRRQFVAMGFEVALHIVQPLVMSPDGVPLLCTLLAIDGHLAVVSRYPIFEIAHHFSVHSQQLRVFFKLFAQQSNLLLQLPNHRAVIHGGDLLPLNVHPYAQGINSVGRVQVEIVLVVMDGQ